ncbi:MAG: response regulator [Candidatus Latescibacteria bacterium]|nr:response regulator [Candidatus Latescibacterota bacterium]
MEKPAASKGDILVVDDQGPVLDLVGNILSKHGYQARGAASGAQALEQVKAHLPDLVLLDVSMPEMDGYELCRRLKADPHARDLPVIFVSAHGEAADKLKAFAAGGVDYVTKPFQVYEVLARIQTHLNLHRQHQHLQRAYAELERRGAGPSPQLERVQRSLDGALGALGRLAALRNPNGAGHPTRTAKLARAIAQELGLDAERLEGLGTAALLCDLGMAGVPESILLKPEALTPAELTLVRTHPQLGADLAQPLALPWPVDQFILQHHERLDGSGYPEGLKGEEIALEARILAVADVMTALCAARMHRPAMSVDQALVEMVSNAGRLYDAQVAGACVRLFREGGFRLGN